MSVTGMDRTDAELNEAVDRLGMTPPRLMGVASAFLRWVENFHGLRGRVHQVRIVEGELPAPALTLPDRGIIWMTAAECERMGPLDVGTPEGMLKFPVPHGKIIHEAGHNMAPSRAGWEEAGRGLRTPLVLMNELLAEREGASGMYMLDQTRLFLAVLGVNAKRTVLHDLLDREAEGRAQWESAIALALGRVVIDVIPKDDPLIEMMLGLFPDIFSDPVEAEKRLRAVMLDGSGARATYRQIRVAGDWVEVFDDLWIGDEPEPEPGGDEGDPSDEPEDSDEPNEGEGPGPTPDPDDEDSDGEDSDKGDGEDSDGEDSDDDGTPGEKAIDKFREALADAATQEGGQEKSEDPTQAERDLQGAADQSIKAAEDVKTAERRAQRELAASWVTGAGINSRVSD